MTQSVSDLLLQQSGIVAQDLAVAFDLLDKGEVAAAGAMFERMTRQDPRFAEAWYGLGQCLAKTNRLKPAAQCLSRAIQLKPDMAEAYNSLGNVFQAQNRLSQARQAYENGLSIAPQNPSLHYNLGVTRRRMDDIDEAIACFRTALRYQPDYAQAHFSLGNAFRDRGETTEAEREYETAVRLRPDYADALCNLGALRAARNDLAGAVECFQAALTGSPKHIFALKNASLMYHKLGRHPEGVATAFRALEITPDDMMLHYHMGEMLYALIRAGSREAAQRHAAAWVKAFPNNPVARHMAAAASGGGTPDRADDAYVKETFDRFANDFERVLGDLGYNVPQMLTDAAFARLGDRAGLVVLDAGCGTGLCGPLLKPRALKMVGVDLSAGMLAKARQRGIYDELGEAELGAYLAGCPHRFDLTVAADVLCYFGDLQPVLSALAAKTAARGLIAFTVEKAPDQASGYVLNPTGRYAHAAEYVRSALLGAGLNPVMLEERAGREEMGQPVPCFLVLAEKA